MPHYAGGMSGIVDGRLRPLLSPRVFSLPMVRAIGKTMVQGKNYGPPITVKRLSTRYRVQHWESTLKINCKENGPFKKMFVHFFFPRTLL
jgi:hypothetical protein